MVSNIFVKRDLSIDLLVEALRSNILILFLHNFFFLYEKVQNFDFSTCHSAKIFWGHKLGLKMSIYKFNYQIKLKTFVQQRKSMIWVDFFFTKLL